MVQQCLNQLLRPAELLICIDELLIPYTVDVYQGVNVSALDETV